MTVTKQEKLDIFGVPVTVLDSYRDAEDSIVERVRCRQKTFCVAINPEKIYQAQTDSELMTLLNTADFHICDGIGAALAARILHQERIPRVTGVQLFFNLIARAEQEKLGVFLLGASPEANDGAYKKLKEMHPSLRIVGCQDGYFKDNRKVGEQINASKADMLFVAMGSPKQEKWISTYRDRIYTPFCMGVGGTFDVVSGNAKWAPKFFRKTGTEFLYRLICDPKRIKRQMVLPKFAFKVLTTKIRGN